MNTSNYKDVICKATLVKNSDGQLEIQTPFQRYSEHVYLNGKEITYSYRTNLTLEGQEVLLITSCIDEHPQLPSEVTKAYEDKNTIAKSWDEAKAHATFQKHYKLTTADAITVTGGTKEAPVVVKYDGADKATLNKPAGLFCTSKEDYLMDQAQVKAKYDALAASVAVAVEEPKEEPLEP